MTIESPTRAARRLEILELLPKQQRARARRKYRNSPKVYNGVRYDSTDEANYAKQLDLELRAGALLDWLRGPTVRLGVPENVYRPDFLVIPVEGRPYFVDVKGVETPKFIRDKKLWRAYARLPLLVVKGGTVVETVMPEPEV